MANHKKKQSLNYIGTDLEAMSQSKNYNKWIIDMVSPYFGKIVAEVGAGIGNLSNLILNHDVDKLIAFEPSVEMYKKLSKKLGEEKNVETINNVFSVESDKYINYFDCILYINVLEHIKDDGREIICAYNCLKTGGHLCIFVPALEFLYSNFDKNIGHYRRYNKLQLNCLIEESKFRISNIKYVDIIGIIPWYIVFVLMKQTLTKNKTYIYDKLIIPFIKIIENMVPIPIGKNLLLIAKKI